MPVSPDDRGERTFAFRDDEVCGNTTTARAGIGNVVNRDIASLLDAGLLQVEWSLPVIIEMPKKRGNLRISGSDHDYG